MLPSVLASATALSAGLELLRRQLLTSTSSTGLPAVPVRLIFGLLAIVALRLRPASSSTVVAVLALVVLVLGLLQFLLQIRLLGMRMRLHHPHPGEFMPLLMLFWRKLAIFLLHGPAPMGTRTAPTRARTDLDGEEGKC